MSWNQFVMKGTTRMLRKPSYQQLASEPQSVPRATPTIMEGRESTAIDVLDTSHRLSRSDESKTRLDVLGIDVYNEGGSRMGGHPSSHNLDLDRVAHKLGMRRRSISYPDLFEGDISNLVCKKPLYPTQDYSKQHPSTPISEEEQGGLTFKMDSQPQGGLTLKIDANKPSHRKLSEKIFSTWFFKKSGENKEDDAIMEAREEEDRRKKTSLSAIVGDKFTAARDFRHLNVTVPQSM